MPRDQKMKYVHNLSTTECYDEIKYWSLWFLDFVEANGLVNDLEAGVGKQEPVVGILLAASKMLQMQTEGMARQEMQVLSEETKWGMQLSNALSDYAHEIFKACDAVANISPHYSTILRGRRMDWHYTDDEGNGIEVDREAQQLRLDLGQAE